MRILPGHFVAIEKEICEIEIGGKQLKLKKYPVFSSLNL
jgi:hypothetical protein